MGSQPSANLGRQLDAARSQRRQIGPGFARVEDASPIFNGLPSPVPCSGGSGST